MNPWRMATVSEERAFIENWWQRKFSMPNFPTGDDVIMFAHALELLKAFRGAGDTKWMTGPSEKGWLEAWWLRKFPANPLKWGSVLNLSDAEELLIEFRKSTEARMRRMKRKNRHAGSNRPAPSLLRRDFQPV